ncbi:MAG TPA: rhomboid family intramembrane serine protease [Rhizomicrobium sp.]|jgi:membrane associated rhomboid family serine protease
MAFLVEDRPRQPFLRAPAVVIGLILLLVAAHVMRVVFFPQWDAWWFHNYALVPARYSQNYLAGHGVNPGSVFERALPFVTYMFLHGSYAHLAVNSGFLLAFGPIVARRFGSVLFLAFFFLCGIAGAVTHLAFNWGSEAPVIGASAAVSGLTAAGFRMLPVISQQPNQELARLWAPHVLVWTALVVAVNVFAGLTGLGTGGGVQLIAWQAHLGGYAAGLFLSRPFDLLAVRGGGRPFRPEA